MCNPLGVQPQEYIYDRHLQANVGQCKNKDDDEHEGLPLQKERKKKKERKKQRNKETNKQRR